MVPLFSPLCSISRRPIWAGTRSDNLLIGQGTPRGQNADTNLRDENAILHAKIDELNACKPSTSTVSHVSICTRCRDVNVDVIHDHIAMIKQQNDHIAKLDAKIIEHELENEKFKFARSMLYSGRLWGTDIPRVH